MIQVFAIPDTLQFTLGHCRVEQVIRHRLILPDPRQVGQFVRERFRVIQRMLWSWAACMYGIVFGEAVDPPRFFHKNANFVLADPCLKWHLSILVLRDLAGLPHYRLKSTMRVF